MRLISIKRVGRASRITIIATSVCPPATMRALSSAASNAQASSMSAGREYSNGAAFMDALRGSPNGWLCRAWAAALPLKSLSHDRNRKKQAGRYAARMAGQRDHALVAAHRHAAIDHDLGAGDETGLVGGQEQSGIGGVAAVAHETERNARHPLREQRRHV